MESSNAIRFIAKVEEAEEIYNSLSEPEKRQALHFLLPLVRRYNSLIILDASTNSESCETVKSGQLGDAIRTFSLLLEKQISKLVDELENSVCDVEQGLSVELTDEGSVEQKEHLTGDEIVSDASSRQKKYSKQQTAVGCCSYRSSVTENVGNGGRQSDRLQLLSTNRRKRSLKRIHSPLLPGEKSEIVDITECSERKQIYGCKIERKQPIKLLVKTAYNQQKLATNGDTACLGIGGRECNFSCLLCDAEFSQETPYLQHLVYAHRSCPSCCRFCRQLLTSAQSIKTHNSCCSKSDPKQKVNNRETSGNLQAPYPIDSETENIIHGVENDSSQEELETKCKDSFNSKFKSAGLGVLQNHRLVHAEENPFQCCECRISFRTMKGLLKHRQTNRHLVKEGHVVSEKKYLCSLCGKKYFRKQALQRHLKHHKEEAPHQCKYCSFTTKEANNLKRHVDLHFESKRNFVCEVCGAAFHARNTLDTHIAFKHSDSRRFQCHVCEATFKVKNALKRHSLVHSEMKSHKCWCGVGFKRLTNLRRHMIKLHGSTDGLLPPIKRVKTLDSYKKAPVSRTDLVDHSISDPSAEDANSCMVPCNEDTSASMVPLSKDTCRNQTTYVVNVSSEQSAPVLLNDGNSVSLQRPYPDNLGSLMPFSHSVGLSNVIKQIQEVFDLSRINMY